MSDKFLKIIITSPIDIEDEVPRLIGYLQNGTDIIHIRKPDYSENQMREFLQRFPSEIRKNLTLHSHFHLAVDLNIGGIHLNSYNKLDKYNKVPVEYTGRVSCSCHSLEEVNNDSNEGYTYLFLSPIYNSISKEGYKSNFNIKSLSPHIKNRNVVALGGVTPEKFSDLENAGFIGSALLGYIWKK